MEYFDILNEAGEPLGFTKARHLVHRDGDWHRTVHIWIIRDGSQILLQHRGPQQESNPNMWDISCAGHCTAGDSSLDAAVRELKEELGWEIKPQSLSFVTSLKSERVSPTLIDREWSDVYLLKIDLPVPIFYLQASEVQAIAWLSIPELKQRVLRQDSTLVEHNEEYTIFLKILEDL